MAYIGNQVTSVPFTTDTFSGNGSQQAFTLSRAPAGTASIAVFIGSAYQPPVGYSLNGVTLTFASAPTAGTNNITVLFLGNGSISQVPSDGSVKLTSLANETYSYINAAFTAANSDLYSQATANAAFLTANAAFITANAGFIQANTPSNVANSAASYANSGFAVANSAFSTANGRVNTANTNTFSATQTFNGSTSTQSIKLTNAGELANISATAPTSTTTFYVNTGAVQYITGNNTNNWTLNLTFSSTTSLNTAMAIGDSVSVTQLVTNSATAYYPSAFTIDGTSVTPKWQGGTAPTSGNASSIDSYTFVIIKTASATFTVLASQTKFA
jgi:hypothetical protein